jgi:hypothetical protein
MSFVQLIPDEPCVEVDLLPERKRLIEQIAHAVAFSDPPLVVGVHGDWGSGKTSFLHSLKYELSGLRPNLHGADKLPEKKGISHVVPIWFEAWRYQYESTPVVALLHEIRAQLSFGQKFLLESKKLSEIAIRGALLSIEDVTKKIGFQASKIQQAGENWERENLAATLPSAQLREFLDDALSKLLGDVDGHDRRLVVFIDDLDRCEPETAFRLLESLKVYLHLRRCVFVLGINQREVERALAKVMPSGNKDAAQDSAELTIRAHEYLEKICANVWHLPLVPLERQTDLINAWLTGKLPDDFLAKVVELIRDHDYLPANARRIKAFANSLLRHYMARVDEKKALAPSPEDAPLTCIIAALQQFHPHLWRHVESEPEFLLELQAFASGSLDKPPAAGTGGRRRASDLHPELAALELPNEGKPDAKGNLAFTSRFADHAYGNVLHCQRLLASFKFTRDQVRKHLGR